MTAEMFTFQATRGQPQFYGGRTLKALALGTVAIDNDDPAVANVSDIEADEVAGDARPTLTGVSWDVDALQLLADDPVVTGLTGTVGAIVWYDNSGGALVGGVRFDPVVMTGGDIPVVLPGGALIGEDTGDAVLGIIAGDGVTVDDSDARYPVVSATGGGGGDLPISSDDVTAGGGTLTTALGNVFATANAARDAIAADAWLQPVRVVATSSVDYSTGGLLTIDGVTLAVGDKVLLTANGGDNRIRAAAVGGWTDVSAAYVSGATVRVTEGTLHAGSEWYISTPDPFVPGSDDFTWTEFTGGGGGSETTTTMGTLIHGATGKTTPVDADELGLVDSAASNILKKLTWANLKATLKTYFDTLYDATGAASAAAAASQPVDSDLTAIAALTTDSFGRDLLTKTTAAAIRTYIGTVIGTDVEAHDADLTTIGGLTPSNDDLLQRKSGAWANRTLAQVKSDLALNNVDNTSDATKALLVANNQTGTTYTLVLGDAAKVIEANNASAIALTVPTNASVAFPIGTVIEVYQMGAGQVTVSGAGVTFRAPRGLKTAVQYAVISLWKRDTDTWVVSGDATT